MTCAVRDNVASMSIEATAIEVSQSEFDRVLKNCELEGQGQRGERSRC